MDLMNVLVTSQYLRQIGGGSGGGGSGEGGGSSLAYTHLVADGNTSLDVAVENNTVFVVEGYADVNITIPAGLNDLLFWDCYFFIEFAKADKVSLKLPADIRINGDTPNYVKAGDVWEISINKQGGAILLRT